MLWLERRVVTAIAGDDDRRTGGAISEFVDSSLAAMPQHLRFGVVVESVGLGAWVRIRHGLDPDAATVRRSLTGWEHHPVGAVRQYPKLLSSLVVFAQQELAEAEPGSDR
jgi:hypothetical protein